MESSSAELQRKLHIGEELANRLVSRGLVSLEEVAYVPFEELLKASQLTEQEAQTLRRVAASYLLNESLGDDFTP